MHEVVQQFVFEFYQSKFPMYDASDHRLYLALNDLCRALGLKNDAQRRRVLEDPALEGCSTTLEVETPYRDTVRVQQALCLWVERLPYWLGTLEISRVKPELVERIVLYKREMADALWAMYRSDILPSDILAELDTRVPLERKRYLQAADELAELRRELGGVGEHMQQVDRRLGDIHERLSVIEARYVGVPVNSEQQAHIKKMVAAVAMAFYDTDDGKKRGKGACFAAVWNNLKERFNVADYPELAADQMPAIVDYLKKRYSHFAPGLPFPSAFLRGDQKNLF